MIYLLKYSSVTFLIEGMIILKKIKMIIGLTGILSVITIPTVAIAVAKDVSKLEEVIKRNNEVRNEFSYRVNRYFNSLYSSSV